MRRYVYTLHAQDKFKLPTVKKLGITKQHIQRVIENPLALDESEKPVMIAIGNLTNKLSLSVAYRKVNKNIRVITFYPAEKGRYEGKILQRG